MCLCRGASSGFKKKVFKIILEFYLGSFNEAVSEERKSTASNYLTIANNEL